MTLATRRAEMEVVRSVPPSPSTRNHTVRRCRAAGEAPPPAFEQFSAELRSNLAPATVLENVAAERVVLAAWRLRQISEAESQAALCRQTGNGLPPVSRASVQAEGRLKKALGLLEATRNARRDRWGVAACASSKSGGCTPEPVDLDDPGSNASFEPDLSNEWTPVPDVDEDVDPEFDDAATSRWRDRLAFDADVSESSPVVRGTWVTVGHVVSLIVDGWTWSDILRTHPELTEDDIRACLTYNVEHDEGRGF